MSRPTKRKITIDSSSINRLCHGPLHLCRFFGRHDHWPGPQPLSSMRFEVEGDVREEREKVLSAIATRFPPSYAERLLFAHSINLIVARALFFWVQHFAEDLLYFESVLHLEPEESYYRDHYVHPLEVGCIGAQLLDEVELEGEKLKDILVDSFRQMIAATKGDSKGVVPKYLRQCGLTPDHITVDWLLEAWWVAALYHDLGYFPQKSGRLLGRRVSRTFPYGWNRLLDGLSRQEMEDDLVWRQVEHWTKEVKNFNAFEPEELLTLLVEQDHPALGALTVSALCRRMLQYTTLEPAEFCAFQVASHAILAHDHTGLSKHLGKRLGCGEKPLVHLNYWENPLAVLLVFCDHLSEFHRERLVPSTGRGPGVIRYKSKMLWDSVVIQPEGRILNVQFLKGRLGGDPSSHFREDKQWFLPCRPKGDHEPYLKLDPEVFDVLVNLPISR